MNEYEKTIEDQIKFMNELEKMIHEYECGLRCAEYIIVSYLAGENDKELKELGMKFLKGMKDYPISVPSVFDEEESNGS